MGSSKNRIPFEDLRFDKLILPLNYTLQLARFVVLLVDLWYVQWNGKKERKLNSITFC